MLCDSKFDTQARSGPHELPCTVGEAPPRCTYQPALCPAPTAAGAAAVPASCLTMGSWAVSSSTRMSTGMAASSRIWPRQKANSCFSSAEPSPKARLIHSTAVRPPKFRKVKRARKRAGRGCAASTSVRPIASTSCSVTMARAGLGTLGALRGLLGHIPASGEGSQGAPSAAGGSRGGGQGGWEGPRPSLGRRAGPRDRPHTACPYSISSDTRDGHRPPCRNRARRSLRASGTRAGEELPGLGDSGGFGESPAVPALHSPRAAILLLRHVTIRRRRMRNTDGRGRPPGGAASPPPEGAAVPARQGALREGQGSLPTMAGAGSAPAGPGQGSKSRAWAQRAGK